jgi:hypothetical protein
MHDFVNLCRIKPSELYDLDDAVMKSLERDTLENQVHNVLNPGHSKKKDYGIFRQLAIDAASMHPTSLEALAPNVKTAHDAAVLLLGPLYDTPELDETTATAVIAAVSEQAPFDRHHDEDGGLRRKSNDVRNSMMLIRLEKQTGRRRMQRMQRQAEPVTRKGERWPSCW